MELQNILATLIIDQADIEEALALSQKIESFGPMHLTMILID